MRRTKVKSDDELEVLMNFSLRELSMCHNWSTRRGNSRTDMMYHFEGLDLCQSFECVQFSESVISKNT